MLPNGKGSAKAGLLQTKSSTKNWTEQNPFSFFQTYKKIKNEMVFAGIFWNFSEISFNPASCKTLVELNLR